jgi:hypothetical protein
MHPMAYVFGDGEVVSRSEIYHATIGKLQCRATTQQQYPFIFFLVIPEARRTRMAMGNDVFQFYVRRLQESVENFSSAGWFHFLSREKIGYRGHHDESCTWFITPALLYLEGHADLAARTVDARSSC